MKNKKFYITILSLVCVGLCSCGDWLDVQPKLSVDEEILFSKEQGFKEALTGIYMSMGSTDLYGRELTYGIVDALAQRYRVYQSFCDYTDPLNYQFPSEYNNSKTWSIWMRGYRVITNINNLLSWLDRKGREVILTEGYYDIIRGEALGLRAFLHFDLLRLWGPIYKNDPNGKSIMYRDEVSREGLPLEPASQIVDKIIADLEAAAELLENDPMNIAFPASETESGFLDYRFKRMNKYAVKAMLARVYMYKGDKPKAMAYAREVVTATKANNDMMFKLVSDNTLDRIMSTELIFSLSLNKFEDQVTADFAATNWTYYFVFDKQHIYDIFDVTHDGYNDMRMREGQGFQISNTSAVSLKYFQTGAFSPAVRNTMPLIRLPEMYYIIAECTPDLSEATDMINTIRSARGIDTSPLFLNEEERLAAIEKEYRKEFYAEGQLWYFYKRHAYPRFTGYPDALPDLIEANYRFNIPDDEVELGTVNG